ncbi:MAG: 1-acyl-sn-glycerol-3-phosphate acyltransferase [Deltaproteobacteria bacterium]|nr:1-acyl-sn-glycerol-3-phosphate acyltransferase [Deltaproteobacteria bacterium]
MIRFIFINIFIAVHTIIISLCSFIISFFDKDGTLIHRKCAVPWAKTILFICGVKLEVKGVENIREDTPCIYMSNHQSYFDIFALLAGLPVNFKFIMKKELMRIPLLGTAMKRAGYISLDREDSRKAIVSVNMAADRIRNGTSVLIFPEGTRSRDGVVGEFKKGGFHLAMKSGCDIVPVAIVKSRDIVPKGSLKVNKGIIYFNIGKPIPVTEYSKRDMPLLMEKVRESVLAMMKEE